MNENEIKDNLCGINFYCQNVTGTHKCVYFSGKGNICKYDNMGVCESFIAITNKLFISLKKITGKEITLYDLNKNNNGG